MKEYDAQYAMIYTEDAATGDWIQTAFGEIDNPGYGSVTVYLEPVSKDLEHRADGNSKLRKSFNRTGLFYLVVMDQYPESEAAKGAEALCSHVSSYSELTFVLQEPLLSLAKT